MNFNFYFHKCLVFSDNVTFINISKNRGNLRIEKLFVGKSSYEEISVLDFVLYFSRDGA